MESGDRLKTNHDGQNIAEADAKQCVDLLIDQKDLSTGKRALAFSLALESEVELVRLYKDGGFKFTPLERGLALSFFASTTTSSYLVLNDSASSEIQRMTAIKNVFSKKQLISADDLKILLSSLNGDERFAAIRLICKYRLIESEELFSFALTECEASEVCQSPYVDSLTSENLSHVSRGLLIKILSCQLCTSIRPSILLTNSLTDVHVIVGAIHMASSVAHACQLTSGQQARQIVFIADHFPEVLDAINNTAAPDESGVYALLMSTNSKTKYISGLKANGDFSQICTLLKLRTFCDSDHASLVVAAFELAGEERARVDLLVDKVSSVPLSSSVKRLLVTGLYARKPNVFGSKLMQYLFTEKDDLMSFVLSFVVDASRKKAWKAKTIFINALKIAKENDWDRAYLFELAGSWLSYEECVELQAPLLIRQNKLKTGAVDFAFDTDVPKADSAEYLAAVLRTGNLKFLVKKIRSGSLSLNTKQWSVLFSQLRLNPVLSACLASLVFMFRDIAPAEMIGFCRDECIRKRDAATLKKLFQVFPKQILSGNNKAFSFEVATDLDLNICEAMELLPRQYAERIFFRRYSVHLGSRRARLMDLNQEICTINSRDGLAFLSRLSPAARSAVWERFWLLRTTGVIYDTGRFFERKMELERLKIPPDLQFIDDEAIVVLQSDLMNSHFKLPLSITQRSGRFYFAINGQIEKLSAPFVRLLKGIEKHPERHLQEVIGAQASRLKFSLRFSETGQDFHYFAKESCIKRSDKFSKAGYVGKGISEDLKLDLLNSSVEVRELSVCTIKIPLPKHSERVSEVQIKKVRALKFLLIPLIPRVSHKLDDPTQDSTASAPLFLKLNDSDLQVSFGVLKSQDEARIERLVKILAVAVSELWADKAEELSPLPLSWQVIRASLLALTLNMRDMAVPVRRRRARAKAFLVRTVLLTEILKG